MSIQPTTLTYMEKMDLLEDQATVVDVLKQEDGRTALILDQTIFYPQGGGQPYDQGTITGGENKFSVEEVRFKDGLVYHIGTPTSGTFQKDQTVTLSINPDRRILHNKLHTAGHLIDLGMRAIGMNLTPGKGYHFPQGAYVEYEGTLDEDERATLISKLEAEASKLVANGHPVSVKVVSYDELAQMANYVPDYIPKNKPTRAMIVNSFPAIPCGGTHVLNTKDIARIKIEKIKNKKGNLRISYSVE